MIVNGRNNVSINMVSGKSINGSSTTAPSVLDITSTSFLVPIYIRSSSLGHNELPVVEVPLHSMSASGVV